MSLTVRGQRLLPAFQKYENGDYEGAYSSFKKATNDPKESAAAYYGIGLGILEIEDADAKAQAEMENRRWRNVSSTKKLCATIDSLSAYLSD